MARSPVDKYEQILAADPRSLVFVDLARALLERGDAARALEVCRDGIAHHPASIAGLVTWGRAHLALGQAADAMGRFEQAIAVDRKNPYAYNLIGELLVQKNLHRSALPILEKAASLQPADARVRGWLDQARRSLGMVAPADAAEEATIAVDLTAMPGGAPGESPPEAPPPAPPEAPAQDAAAGEEAEAAPEPSPPAATSRPAAPASVRPPAPRRPSGPRPPAPKPASPPVLSPTPPEPPQPVAPPDPIDRTLVVADPGPSGPPEYTSGPAVDAPAPVVVDPFHSIDDGTPLRADGDATRDMDLAGLAATDQARAEQMEEEEGPPPLPGRDPADGDAGSRPATPPLLRPGARVIPPPLRHVPARTGALEHILPDLPPEPAPHPAPPAAAPVEDPHHAAAEYERSLRVELESVPPVPVRRSRRVVLTLAVAGLAAVISAGTAWVLLRSSRQTDEILGAARNALARDTLAAYRASARALDEVLEGDPANGQARALQALMLAQLSTVYGSGEPDRIRAATILADPKLLQEDPEVVLAARFLLAQGDDRRIAADDILSRPAVGSGPLMHGLAGAVLLERDEPGKAIERFNSAMAAAPGHVPTLVRVGDYYRARGDHPEALRYYALALTIVEDHPGALLGAADSRLATGEGYQESLASLARLGDEAQVPVADRLRWMLLKGRLLGAVGRRDDALDQLARAAPRAGTADEVRELAGAYEEIGAIDRAQAALQAALPKHEGDADLREAYARILLAREDHAGVLALAPQKGERGLSVVRGIALYQLGRYREARGALRSSQSEAGKMPVEAVVYLALIDLGNGEFEKARSNLERLARTAAARPLTHRAYAQVLLAARRPEEAERELRAALEGDPRDVEARCVLGRLLLERGQSEEGVAELERAVARNPFHVEAQVALVQVRLKSGDLAGARERAQALLDLAPADPRALTTSAAVLLAAGQAEPARAAAEKAVRGAPRSAEARLHLASALAASGRVDDAVSALQDAVKALPRDARLRVALGDLLLAGGDAARAQDAFAAALALDRSSAPARAGRALALSARAKAKDAEKDLRSALSGNRPPAEEALLRSALASVLADQGKGLAAEKEAARALKLDAGCAAAHFERGRALSMLGRAADARADLEQALQLAPGGRVALAARKLLD